MNIPPWTESLAPLDAQLRSGQLGLDEAVRDTPSLPVVPPEHELIDALQDRGSLVVPVLLLACCLRNHNRPLLYWLQQLLAPALALSQAEVAALLRLELCCRNVASDVSLLPNCPAEWIWVSWPRPGGSCVVSRGHAMRVERLRPSPRMALVHGFLSPEECAHVISRARDRMAPSVVVRSEEARAHSGQVSGGRSSTSCSLTARDDDDVVARAVQRAAFLAGLQPQHSEAVQVHTAVELSAHLHTPRPTAHLHHYPLPAAPRPPAHPTAEPRPTLCTAHSALSRGAQCGVHSATAEPRPTRLACPFPLLFWLLIDKIRWLLGCTDCGVPWYSGGALQADRAVPSAL